MFYYVYKITNTVNGKIYIGKRKSTNPAMDPYMGSGKLIKFAILKYGIESFTKEILAIFETEDAAFDFEKQLVSKTFVDDDMTYNLHEGGHGGFHHINRLPVDQRPNVIKVKEMISDGRMQLGGDTTQFFTEASYEKIRAGSIRGNEALKGLPIERKDVMKQKMSSSASGSRNSQYGVIWCVEEASTDLSGRKKFREVPDGWISTTEWKDRRKTRTPNYGKHWYNDGHNNYLLASNSDRIQSDNLVRGRLPS